MFTKKITMPLRRRSYFGNWETACKISEIIHKYTTLDRFKTAEKLYALTPLSNFYLESGSRVTKPIKAFLSKQVSGIEKYNIWTDISREISALYEPDMHIRAFWGIKQKIGLGVYEEFKTCLRIGGENEDSGNLFKKWKRTQCLVLEDINDNANRGRCIVFFAGGRNIYLTNFYFAGKLPNNPLIFITALRKLLGLSKVTFSEIKDYPIPNLPIFQNNKAYLVKTDRSFQYNDLKIICPHCDSTVPAKEFISYWDKNNSSRLIVGCCEECARRSAPLAYCDECDTPLSNENTIYQSNRRTYCQLCFDEYFTICTACGEVCYKDDVGYINFNPYCSDCAAYCEECEQWHLKADMYIETKGRDTYYYCMDCYEKCNICGCVYAADNMHRVTIGKYEEVICIDCYEDFICQECGTAFEPETEYIEVKYKRYCHQCAGTCIECERNFLFTEMNEYKICKACDKQEAFAY